MSTPNKAEKVYYAPFSTEPIAAIIEECKKLKERLRLAEEFIRSNHYQWDEIHEGHFCTSCGVREGNPCKPDCELQKILGK